MPFVGGPSDCRIAEDYTDILQTTFFFSMYVMLKLELLKDDENYKMQKMDERLRYVL